VAVPVPLGGQQVGDQVAAEHEEDVNPQESPGKSGQLLMKGNNRNNGQTAQSIQARPSESGLIGCRAFRGMCRHCADPPRLTAMIRILARSMGKKRREK
jgi:hypothetical protein